MKVVQRSLLHIASTDRSSGDNGAFDITGILPLNMTGSNVFKIWARDVFITHDMPWTTSLDTFQYTADFTNWQTVTLPTGNFDIDQLVAWLDAYFDTGGVVIPGVPTGHWLRCTFDETTGKMTFAATGALPPSFSFKFSTTTRAAAKLGFEQGRQYYNSPQFTITSSNPCVVNPYAVLDLHTSFPRNSFEFTGKSYKSSKLMCRMPLTVPYMGTNIWTDEQGANAIVENYRDHLDNIHIELRDNLGVVVKPVSPWYITFIIEMLVDETVESQAHTQVHLQHISEATQQLAEMTKLKMVKKDLDANEKNDDNK